LREAFKFNLYKNEFILQYDSESEGSVIAINLIAVIIVYALNRLSRVN
jgi:hypothetical protein